VQAVIRAVKAGDWQPGPDGTVVAAGITLLPGEFTERLVAMEPESTAALPDGAGLVVVDLTLTDELEAEGWAKDRVRELQEVRRAAGLAVSDRVRVQLGVPARRREWARRHQELIAKEVLAVAFDVVHEAEIDGVQLGDGVRASVLRA